MEHDSNLDEHSRYFKQIEAEAEYYLDFIQEFAFEILNNGVSKYPVFVFYQGIGPDLGKLILHSSSTDSRWNVNISVMEEFVKKNLVSKDQFPQFKTTWKDPETHCCIFLIDQGHGNFIYLPYHDQREKQEL
jgi:hypothetical protein